MVGPILIFLAYMVSAILTLYFTMKLLTLYSPLKPRPYTLESIKVKPGRWRETFSSRASNIGSAVRDATRESIEHVVNVLESKNVYSSWIREKKSPLGVFSESLKTLRTLSSTFNLSRAFRITVKLVDFYNSCRKILKYYHLVEEDENVRIKVDKALKKLLDLKSQLEEEVGT